MDFPKLVYQDFYKFLVSLGFILLMFGLGLAVYITDVSMPHGERIFVILYISIIVSIFIMLWAGNKWYKNQELLDRKLKAEVMLIENRVEIEPEKEIKVRLEREIVRDGTEKIGVSAIVTYKIASILPKLNTVFFDFLKDWKVWFLIKNHETKKYKAYVKIKFICSDGYKEDVSEGYYGGTKAWNLNALATIIAPGLGISKEIRKKAKEKKKIEIRIFCEIKNENDELIEEKLPIGYVYDYKNQNWYYEP